MNPQAVILAGGASSRFGSNKIFHPLEGLPMLEKVAFHLKQAGFTITLSGDPLKLKPFDYPVICDSLPGQGPLAALCDILKKVSTSVLVTPCDVPRITAKQWKYFWDHQSSHPLTVISLTNKPLALPGIFNPSLLPLINQLLAHNRRDVKSLFEKTSYGTLDFKELEHWDPCGQLTNINTLQDLSK